MHIHATSTDRPSKPTDDLAPASVSAAELATGNLSATYVSDVKGPSMRTPSGITIYAGH
jgi:hypothetical protein